MTIEWRSTRMMDLLKYRSTMNDADDVEDQCEECLSGVSSHEPNCSCAAPPPRGFIWKPGRGPGLHAQTMQTPLVLQECCANRSCAPKEEDDDEEDDDEEVDDEEDDDEEVDDEEDDDEEDDDEEVAEEVDDDEEDEEEEEEEEEYENYGIRVGSRYQAPIPNLVTEFPLAGIDFPPDQQKPIDIRSRVFTGPVPITLHPKETMYSRDGEECGEYARGPLHNVLVVATQTGHRAFMDAKNPDLSEDEIYRLGYIIVYQGTYENPQAYFVHVDNVRLNQIPTRGKRFAALSLQIESEKRVPVLKVHANTWKHPTLKYVVLQTTIPEAFFREKGYTLNKQEKAFIKL